MSGRDTDWEAVGSLLRAYEGSRVEREAIAGRVLELTGGYLDSLVRTAQAGKLGFSARGKRYLVRPEGDGVAEVVRAGVRGSLVGYRRNTSPQSFIAKAAINALSAIPGSLRPCGTRPPIAMEQSIDEPLSPDPANTVPLKEIAPIALPRETAARESQPLSVLESLYERHGLAHGQVAVRCYKQLHYGTPDRALYNIMVTTPWVLRRIASGSRISRSRLLTAMRDLDGILIGIDATPDEIAEMRQALHRADPRRFPAAERPAETTSG